MKELVKSATTTDRAAIVDLLRNLHLPTSDLPETLENFKILKNEDRVIGVCGLEIYGTVALLRSLAVATGNQQQGIGKILLEVTLQSAKEKEVEEVYLITNTAAAFFAKWGFVPVDRNQVPAIIQATAQFSFICPVSATVMHRAIR